MQSAFTIVVFGVVAFSLIMSLGFLVSRGSAYDQIGQGGFARDQDSGGGNDGPAPGPAPGSEAARVEQEREIRQMLQARSDRMVRRGAPPLDIDAEVAKLSQPVTSAVARDDPALAGEVRQLVLARNARRARQGQEPLDVDAEVQRTLRELSPDA
jgi:hypothetical protein